MGIRARSWMPVAAALSAFALASLPAGAVTPRQVSGPPTEAAAASPGDELRIYLATYGQGAAVWELFGHNALWVQDARSGETRSYNWGSFSFKEPGFVPRLLRGSMRYWLAVEDANQEVAAYQVYDRSITVQELNLTPAQKLALKEFVEWNALPENAYYDYHYFRDNCSTRVRDALDRVLDGQLARQLQAIHTRETFRSQSLRLTARAPLTYTGIELGLADSADHQLNAWEEAFIPMELMQRLRAVRVTAADGSLQPLVQHEVPLFVSSRPAPLAAPPNRVPVYLALGILIGGLFLLLARIGALLQAREAGGGARAVRWALALSASAWSLVVGFFGLLVLFLWVGTGHTFTYGNESLFQVNPLPLILAVLVPVSLRRRGTARRATWIVALVVAALSVLGLAAKVLPGFDQMNHDIMALMIPAHLGMLAALWLALYRQPDRGTSPTADTPPRGRRRAAAKTARPQR